MNVFKTNSKERVYWSSTTESYEMNATKVLNEVFQALHEFEKLYRQTPTLIEIHADMKFPLDSYYAMNHRCSVFDPEANKIMGIPCMFRHQPEYDYIVT